ncbi:MAG: ImmA/IrrE family metallo-endopeptidase [Thermodesulfobacteriota bacterium]
MSLTEEIIYSLESKIPKYNKTPLNYDDFESLCEKEGIITYQCKIPWNGWYLVIDDHPCIIIKKRLMEGHKTFVGFHEYFHFKYHPGTTHFYLARNWLSKIERQASILAALAIIPTCCLIDDIKNNEDISEKYSVPKYLVDFRLDVYDGYRQLKLRR